MENTFFVLASFIFGTIIGSFLNVVIYRLPRGKSIGKPAFSFCPSCGSRIRWYDNIPLISYIVLRGKCRNCKSPISFRYFLVELLTGLSSAFSYLKTGLSYEYFFIFGFVAIMIAITFIDLQFRIIPDQLNFIGFLMGIIYSSLKMNMLDSIAGIFVGAGFLWGIAYFYLRFRGIEGMGMGDIKMMAFVGAYLGWFGALFTIFVGSFVGAVAGIIGAYISKSENKGKFEIPFGPFLAFASVVYLFFGEYIKERYLGGMM